MISAVAGRARFADKVALVTGASGGLGALYARTLAAEGARIVAVDCVAAPQATMVAIDAAGGMCLAVAADLTQPDDVAAMSAAALQAFGRIDILVNNAGGGSNGPGTAAGSIRDERAESWDGLMAINLKTAFLCTQAVAETMKRQRYGKIVNVSSRAARINEAGVHQSPAYASAKTAILGLTRYAARELGPYGITVNCLVPSLVLSRPELKSFWNGMGEMARDKYLKSVALNRLPRPEEVASALLFLCSDDSAYVTGVALDVNGGSFMPS
ncbi:MAG: SDR family oxidoreductase [Alphaproteobacteria bacterium]|nr:SDR family oxidoreductase [Alphaproteobacteria bacterium]